MSAPGIRPLREIRGTSPKVPHLALSTDISGTAIAIPPGALLFIVERPGDVTSVTPIVLESVDHNNLRFRCGCGRPDCTRWVRFKASWRGHHPEGRYVTPRKAQ